MTIYAYFLVRVLQKRLIYIERADVMKTTTLMLSADRVISFKVCAKLESLVFFQIKINIQQIIDVHKWYRLTFYDDKMNKLVFGFYLRKRKTTYHWTKPQL